MPRVVPDQKDKFENDDLFRRLRRESEVRRVEAGLLPYVLLDIASLSNWRAVSCGCSCVCGCVGVCV